MSGSLQGAGGVGGLLMVKDASQGTHFAAYDLNGNVMGLISVSYGTNTARYEYGPFGELIRATGPMAKLNPFRFSTKYQDDETDLLYYGYRYYSASTGRWLSRDPIGEEGGVNLYAFVKNIPSSNIDMLGMASANPRADGTFVVDVESCEIVRVTDDGIANKKAYHFLFPKAAGPSAASFMGCYAGSVNRSIKSEHQIEGSPMWNDTVSLILSKLTG